MSNDVLIAQKTESGYTAKVYDGECVEFDRQNRIVKYRQKEKQKREAERVESENRKAAELQRIQKAEMARRAAILRLFAIAIAGVIVLFGSAFLSQIGMVSREFCLIMMAADIGISSFKAGFVWHEIKN